MSKDPFEELFGPADDDPHTEPRPVPARERLSYEQAERVHTAQLVTEPKRQGGRGAPKALPWIVVGVVAVIAIVVCIVLVNMARANDAGGATSSKTTTTSESPSETPTPSATPSDDAEETEEPETKDPNKVPAVEVGPTSTLDIPAWGVTSQLSQKFGMTSYNIPDNSNLQLTSPLIQSLPEECAAMRTQWGVTKGADGKFTVLKPAETCEAAPELYDELWGLTDAFVKSFKPLG
ncbi:hypothetical protein ACFWHR_09430 [Leucobacter sp. NPDC058333]|uniref:hypothetical protein n=1 Tax=Leucobacter sp. NPDC058333 TaxID=3346450 RepID=UPI0036584F01